jgi:hypothetical protein
MILAGHGRFEAAKLLGLAEVPSIRINDLSEVQKRAYVLADNKLAEEAGWDRELLAVELGELSVLLPDLGLSIDLTGFEIGEIDAITPKKRDEQVPGEDDKVIEPPVVPVTRPGDVWQLGRHRIICGDLCRSEVFRTLLGDERADLVFTDLPSRVPAEYVLESGSVGHDRDFALASGQMTEPAFQASLREVLAGAAAVSKDRALHYLCVP